MQIERLDETLPFLMARVSGNIVMAINNRKTVMRFFSALMLAVFMVVLFSPEAEAERHKKARHHVSAYKKSRKPAVDKSAYIVVDAASGLVIFAKNPDKHLYPASLTKMMTLYLTFEAIENGRLRRNERIDVSSHASTREPSILGLKAGSTIRVEDAILGLVTKSANDAATVLGEAIGGSEERFAQMMTSKARQLGMRNTQFRNASGLFNDGQYSSARDMAILGQSLIYHYPSYYRYFSLSSFTWAGKTFENHNKLMKIYDGMDGIKTGYVHQSGFNLVASAVRGNTRLIGVVFGGTTSRSRNLEMASLLDQGFERMRDPRIAQLAYARIHGKQSARNTIPSSTPAARATDEVAGNQPGFQSMGIKNDGADDNEGDTASEGATARNALQQPTSLNTRPLMVPEPASGDAANSATRSAPPAATTTVAQQGGWAIQVGAFSSHASGLQAAHNAVSKLPAGMLAGGQYQVAPLMTNRGMVYRARVAGLSQNSASSACRILQGSCLVLAMQ